MLYMCNERNIKTKCHEKYRAVRRRRQRHTVLQEMEHKMTKQDNVLNKYNVYDYINTM